MLSLIEGALGGMLWRESIAMRGLNSAKQLEIRAEERKNDWFADEMVVRLLKRQGYYIPCSGPMSYSVITQEAHRFDTRFSNHS